MQFTRFIIPILFILLLDTLAFSQDLTTGETTVLFRNEKTYGVLLHTQGLGLNYRTGKIKTASLRQMYEFELVTMKHPKEIKSINPYFDEAKSYKYGKLNSAAILRTSFARHITLNNKPFLGGVDVRYMYNIGLNLAFLKPVYLSILYPTSIPYQYTVANEKYDPEKHNSDMIYGRASFFKGFDELKIHPGAYAKFGFSFEYGTQGEIVRSLDLGIALDGYLKGLPIMAYDKNNNFFLTLFVSFHFGKREYF